MTTPNPARLQDLRAQASSSLADLRSLRERESRVLSDRRGLQANDYRVSELDVAHLALVKRIRDAETILAPLQEQIDELEKAERQAAAKSAADAKTTANAEIVAAVADRLSAAARIDAAFVALVGAFKDWDASGNVLARHEAIHGRSSQTIFNGRTIRGAVHAAAGGTNLPKALELSRSFDGAASALETECGLWAKFIPATNAA